MDTETSGLDVRGVEKLPQRLGLEEPAILLPIEAAAALTVSLYGIGASRALDEQNVKLPPNAARIITTLQAHLMDTVANVAQHALVAWTKNDNGPVVWAEDTEEKYDSFISDDYYDILEKKS